MMGGDCAVQNASDTDYFGIVVKTARQQKSLTQTKLAERLSISTRYLKAIENSGQKPSYDLLVRIIQELDIPADTVFRPGCNEENYSVKIIPLRKVT